MSLASIKGKEEILCGDLATEIYSKPSQCRQYLV